jgi:hypothetical protein
MVLCSRQAKLHLSLVGQGGPSFHQGRPQSAPSSDLQRTQSSELHLSCADTRASRSQACCSRDGRCRCICRCKATHVEADEGSPTLSRVCTDFPHLLAVLKMDGTDASGDLPGPLSPPVPPARRRPHRGSGCLIDLPPLPGRRPHRPQPALVSIGHFTPDQSHHTCDAAV